MANGKFVAYYRVSTAKQGQSGLGLEAQQESVQGYLNGGEWELLSTYREIETGRGSDPLDKRPQLKAALEDCRKYGATLIIAKLDRLARNVHFVSGLMETKVKFVACDMPEANELTIHIMAAFAEHEAKRISQRTKDALAIAKLKGTQLGKAGKDNLRQNLEKRRMDADEFAKKYQNLLLGFINSGLSQRKIADELNRLAIPSRAKGLWTQTKVQRMISRIDRLSDLK